MSPDRLKHLTAMAERTPDATMPISVVKELLDAIRETNRHNGFLIRACLAMRMLPNLPRDTRTMLNAALRHGTISR